MIHVFGSGVCSGVEGLVVGLVVGSAASISVARECTEGGGTSTTGILPWHSRQTVVGVGVVMQMKEMMRKLRGHWFSLDLSVLHGKMRERKARSLTSHLASGSSHDDRVCDMSLSPN